MLAMMKAAREMIFGADLAEVDAAVFEGEAAAGSVVADLHELVLQGLFVKS